MPSLILFFPLFAMCLGFRQSLKADLGVRRLTRNENKFREKRTLMKGAEVGVVFSWLSGLSCSHVSV